MMILLQLFATFVMIGVFSFGGGYGMISFIQKEIVTRFGWLEIGEFTDMIAISQATPGPIAVNSATYAGFKVEGIIGALAANIGLLIPALIIVILVSKLLHKNHDNIYIQSALAGLKPVTVALILGSAIMIGIENITTLYNAVICAVAVFLISYLKINPILILFIFGIIGVIFL